MWKCYLNLYKFFTHVFNIKNVVIGSTITFATPFLHFFILCFSSFYFYQVYVTLTSKHAKIWLLNLHSPLICQSNLNYNSTFNWLSTWKMLRLATRTISVGSSWHVSFCIVVHFFSILHIRLTWKCETKTHLWSVNLT